MGIICWKYRTLFFSKLGKDVSEFVVCGALRVNKCHKAFFCSWALSNILRTLSLNSPTHLVRIVCRINVVREFALFVYLLARRSCILFKRQMKYRQNVVLTELVIVTNFAMHTHIICFKQLKHSETYYFCYDLILLSPIPLLYFSSIMIDRPDQCLHYLPFCSYKLLISSSSSSSSPSSSSSSIQILGYFCVGFGVSKY